MTKEYFPEEDTLTDLQADLRFTGTMDQLQAALGSNEISETTYEDLCLKALEQLIADLGGLPE